MNLVPLAQTGMIGELKGAADIIEEVSETLFYFGFVNPTPAEPAGTDTPTWSIMRILVIPGDLLQSITLFQWADGQAAYGHTWDNRAEYEYKFKTF
jgi:hypothetical protein